MIRIIHSADWHLCAPMTCRLDEQQAEERRASQRARFSAMIDYADETGVGAILLAGDTCDDGILPFSVQDDILDRISAHPGIRFFLISGNHDRMGSGNIGGCFSRGRRPMPDNLTVFGDRWETVTLGAGVSVSGISFDGVHEAPPCPVLDAQTYNLVMMHGAIAASGTVLGGEADAIPLPMLEKKNIDYLALGHYHSFDHGALDGRGIRCYAGTPQGRGFDECGKKGFVLLKIEDGVRRGAEFVPFADRMFHRVIVDISDVAAGMLALEDAVQEAVEGIPETDFVRVTLVGEDPAEVVRDTAYLTRRLEERFYYAEVRDERRVKLDAAAYRGDISLRGEFVRRVMAADLTEEERTAILRCGLEVLGT